MSTASISDPQNWPLHVSRRLGTDNLSPSRTKIEYTNSSHTGMFSQGNGLISRHILYQVNRVLSTHRPQDILVGIVWSGPSRMDVYRDIASNHSPHTVGVVAQDQQHWQILNQHWSDHLSHTWYREFSSIVGDAIRSYEHILRTQWFLKLHGIKYFMSTITAEVFAEDLVNHPEINYLYSMIDFTKFLPISSGIYEWARDQSGLSFSNHDLCHLTTEQNILLTDQIIMPFIESL